MLKLSNFSLKNGDFYWIASSTKPTLLSGIDKILRIEVYDFIYNKIDVL